MNSAVLDNSPRVLTRGGWRCRVGTRWAFRLAAVLLGLSVFAMVEVCCIVAGLGSADIAYDPFVEFSSVRPLFEISGDGRTYRTALNRRRYFKNDSFDVQKAPGEFRIFVLGGSTVQGNPFSIETSFPTYLQMALEQAEPDRLWKVVNCGGVSYASYRLFPVMQECLNYQPDLMIYCGGHNEFLEDVTYKSTGSASPILQQTFSTLNHLRSFRLLRGSLIDLVGFWNTQESSAAFSPGSPATTILPEEVDTLLDHDGGLNAYHRDDSHAQAVTQHFRINLHRMVEICRRRSVPLMMILPPSNYCNCPPFKSQFSMSTSQEQQEEIRTLLQQAREIIRSAPTDAAFAEAIRTARAATTMDPRFALSWYELGQLQMSARHFDNAEVSFRRARDEDVCPLRMTTPLENAMSDIGADDALLYLDAHALLRSKCRNGIVGENVLIDHVHPSFAGHQEIAIAIVDRLIDAEFVSDLDDHWKENARSAYKDHLQQLDDSYFLRGRRTLKNLQLWAAGRSGGPPLPAQKP